MMGEASSLQSQAAATASANNGDVKILSSDYRKVVVVGSPGAGKSCLVQRAATDKFIGEYRQTFGADLLVKQAAADSKRGALHIWTVGGHERYRPLLDQFYMEAQCAILVFDVLDMSSFQDLRFWYNEIKREAIIFEFNARIPIFLANHVRNFDDRVVPNAKIFLVGTKADQADLIKVNEADAMKQAQEWNVPYKQVSSKTGINVTELFAEIADTLHPN